MNYLDCFKTILDFEGRTPKESIGKGSVELIVYRDGEEGEDGTYIRYLHVPPGYKGDLRKHPFDEIVYVLEGEWIDTKTGDRRGPGTMAVFPAGTEHGPMYMPKGAVFLEIRHYAQNEIRHNGETVIDSPR